MPPEAALLLANGIFVVLGMVFAGIARSAARDTLAQLRRIRSQVDEIDLQQTLNSAHIKRLTASVGALGRWTQPPKPETVDGLPDPATDPEKWRAAVRRMADHQAKKPKGTLQ